MWHSSYLFLTLVLDEDQWLASRSGRVTPGTGHLHSPQSKLDRSVGGLGPGLDTELEDNPLTLPGIKTRSSP
jgi:hypothetical protein